MTSKIDMQEEIEFDFIKLIHDSSGRANAKVIFGFRDLITKIRREDLEEVRKEVEKDINNKAVQDENEQWDYEGNQIRISNNFVREDIIAYLDSKIKELEK